MKTYETMSGEMLALPQDMKRGPGLEAFFGQLQRELEDDTVTVEAFMTKSYGLENPLLKNVDGRAVVTAEAFASPWYHALTDMLVRKQVQQNELDFTMSVTEAAQVLNRSESAVYALVKNSRLAARRLDGVLMLRAEQVHAFDGKRRGPLPRSARG